MNTYQLQKQVECPICMEQFRTPKQLPCQHSFCLQCLQRIHDIDGGKGIICPECRGRHRIPANGVAGFPTSLCIQRMISAIRETNVPTQQPSATPVPDTTRKYDRTEDHDVVRYSNTAKLPKPKTTRLTTVKSQFGNFNITPEQRLPREPPQRVWSRKQVGNLDAPHISSVRGVPVNTRRGTSQYSAEASVGQDGNSGATASVYNSSTCEIDCDPCSSVGDYVLAVGYCSECKEYYCQTCYRVHSKNRATKDHTLLDQSSMPTITITAVSTSIASMSITQGSDADDTQFRDEYHFNRDLNIKFLNEAFDCYIIGMTALTDKELVIVDFKNRSAKMIDFDNDLMVGFIQFGSEPCDIATISDTEVAITFADDHLAKILSTSGGFSVKTTLKLGGVCLAVQYCNDKLYVSYRQPVKFQILNLSGGVKKTIKPDAQFLEHCTKPRYIDVHPDESKIYVSDWSNNVVLCMDMNGTMLAVYRDEGLETPKDITFTPFGTIYLCNRDQSTVYMIPENLGEPRVILGKSDGIRAPEAMCFCHSRKLLFVSSASTDATFRNVIKVYQYT